MSYQYTPTGKAKIKTKTEKKSKTTDITRCWGACREADRSHIPGGNGQRDSPLEKFGRFLKTYTHNYHTMQQLYSRAFILEN